MPTVFADDQGVTGIVDSGDAGEVLGDFHQEVGVGEDLRLVGVDKAEDFLGEDLALFYQYRTGLVQAGGAEFETTGEGFAVLNVAPGVEPRIVGRRPEIADQQAFGGVNGGGPTVFIFDDIGDDAGRRVVRQTAQIDFGAVHLQRVGPADFRDFRCWHRAFLHKTARAVGVDDGTFVQEGRADGRVLHYVVYAAQVAGVGDGFRDGEDRLFFPHADGAGDFKTG